MTHERVMTDAEFEPYFAKARELSAFFHKIGPKYDEENTFAYPSIQPFKDSGLGALSVPREYGGPGGDILHVCKIIAEMSRGDSAITLSYNMHYIMVGLSMCLMTEVQKKYWLGRVVSGDILFGPFSEERAGFSGLADMLAVPQPAGGWRLYGKKTWGTLCEAADIITTNATITDADGNLPSTLEGRVNAEGFFIADFAVDRNGEGDGIRIDRSWNALGMRATATHVVHFDGFYIPEEGYICPWRDGSWGVLEWASLLFASVYYGMQLRILEESLRILSRKHLGMTFAAIAAADTRVGNIGHVVDGIGDMAARCEISRRLIYQTCNDLLDGYDDEWPAVLRVPYIGLAKTQVAENVMYMSKRAMSLVGGSSFRKGTIFERLYRDSAASMFQPLNADQTYTYIGEHLLAQDELND
jgi:alkylation response protein AidB-like acyl-CoA dehydrogenase